MAIKIKSQMKGFAGILLATVIPTLIMFIIFASAYEPTITGAWTKMLWAAIAMVAYGLFVRIIGVKKYMKRGR